MKLQIVASAFLAQVYGRIGLKPVQNLHETGYDHGHLDNASCENKAMMYETDNRGLGCDAYAGGRGCG